MMPKLTNRVPSYRKHKMTGQAVVTLNGRDHYLGKHGTHASKNAYEALVGEWLSSGRQLSQRSGAPSEITITELLAAYLRFATGYYQKDSQATGELGKIKVAMKALKRLYGSALVSEFGPRSFKAVRQTLIDNGIGRKYVNDQAARIKRIFRWGVESELVPPSVTHGLEAVAGLRRGRCSAPEPSRVPPVPVEYVAAVKPYVSRQVWAMIQVQQLTGMRPGEVCAMRGQDIEMGGDVWLYRPSSHKTEHYGHERIVEIGPRAQRVLQSFLTTNTEANLFSPDEAMKEHFEKRRQDRVTPLPSVKRVRRKRHPKLLPRSCYDRDSYRRAIARACERADIPRWHPHQLRHSYATEVRRRFGLDAARILLGHRSLPVTEMYAEIDRSKARDIVAEIG